MVPFNKPTGLSRRELLRMSMGLAMAPYCKFASMYNSRDESVRSSLSSVNEEFPLEKRAIPVSGELLPVVGLGTWRTFDAGQSKQKRAVLLEVLRTLLQHNATVIDSSPMYGSSESVVGDLVKDLDARSKLFFATKVWTRGKDEGIRQMNQSFALMQTKTMDLMQVHNLVDVHTQLATIKEWKAGGRIRYAGLTHYMPSVYPEMIRLAKSEKPDFIQFCYNIATRDAEKELLPLAKEKGIAVIINRPFEEGQLFSAVKGRALPGWAGDWGIQNWAQFFLKFILSHPAVTCVIPGTSNPSHLKENLGAATGQLPDEKTRNRMADYFNDR